MSKPKQRKSIDENKSKTNRLNPFKKAVIENPGVDITTSK